MHFGIRISSDDEEIISMKNGTESFNVLSFFTAISRNADSDNIKLIQLALIKEFVVCCIRSIC